MSQDISNKTRSGLYWNVGLKIPYEIFRFAASILTARILSPSDFGIVSVATMVIMYANSFTNIGLNQVLVQKQDITESHIKTVFTVDIVASLLFALSIFISAENIAMFFNSHESINVLRVMSIVFILTTIHDLPYVLLRRELEFRLITIVDMCREIGMTLITLWLAYEGYGFWSIVYGYLIALGVAAIYLVYKTKIKLTISYDHQSMKEMIDKGLWSFLQMQIYFLSNRIDRILIGRFFNMFSLGIYEKSKSLSQMPSESLGDKLYTVFFSSFSRLQNSRVELASYLNKGVLIVSAILFPIYSGLFVTAHHFVLVLFGEKWYDMIVILKIMSIAGIFSSLNGLLSAFVVGTGFFRLYTIIYGICALFLFVGCLLVSDYSIVHIAYIYLIYTLLLMILSLVIAKTKFNINIKELFISCLPALLASILMGIVVVIVKSIYFSQITFSGLLAQVIIGVFVYALIMIFIPSNQLSLIRNRIYTDLERITKSKIFNKNT